MMRFCPRLPQLFVCLVAVTGIPLQSDQMRSASAQQSSAPVVSAAQRTDSFETKLKLLEDAWHRKDFDLARSLTSSLRDTVMQTQVETQNPGVSLTHMDSKPVNSLPAEWTQWAAGWSWFQTFTLEEIAGELRRSEPVEISISFPAAQASDLHRELRLACIQDGQLAEVPCQIFHEVRRNDERSCRVLLMADSQPLEKRTYVVFYGNPAAERPNYPSDLKTEGEGYGLDIFNAYFKASLSRQTGQLERLTLRREHGLELFAGGEGHGEAPGIDWAHDYVDAGFFQKLRISLWDACPDYEVIRGPLCTIVRRWGFPRSPIHPVDSPSRLNVDVEYRFYAGLPWFHKFGKMTAVQDFRAEALRDDEWVFSGQSFTNSLWVDRDGKVQTSDVPGDKQDDLHGVGFYHKDSQDSFVALFLDHSAEGIPELKHTGSPTMYYKWHGHVWSRYPLPVKDVPAGAVLRQKNAYISVPFTIEDGPAKIERMRRCMMAPLVPSGGDPLQIDGIAEGLQGTVNSTARLARPGESIDSLEKKKQIWDALHDCKDGQLYKADISVVELGLVYDVRIRGDVVTVLMTMPHQGRTRLGYFVDGSTSVHPTLSVPIRERLMQIPGVRHVVVEQTWEPAWTSNRLTDSGREKLGLPLSSPVQ